MDVDGRMLVHPPEIPKQNDSLGWRIRWLQTTPTPMASPTCTPWKFNIALEKLPSQKGQ